MTLLPATTGDAKGRVFTFPIPTYNITRDFDYELPPERIAQRPAQRRDDSRLLVHARDTGRTEHRRFADLPQLLRPGDLLVVNDTRVLPARIPARKPLTTQAYLILRCNR